MCSPSWTMFRVVFPVFEKIHVRIFLFLGLLDFFIKCSRYWTGLGRFLGDQNGPQIDMFGVGWDMASEILFSFEVCTGRGLETRWKSSSSQASGEPSGSGPGLKWRSIATLTSQRPLPGNRLVGGSARGARGSRWRFWAQTTPRPRRRRPPLTSPKSRAGAADPVALYASER